MRSLIITLILVTFSDEEREGDKIVGGTNVDISDYPYQVVLLYSNEHLCGGSIISPNWILTAAHCIFNRSVELFSVRVGSTYRHTGGHVHSVVNDVIHEQFSKSINDYDIALLQLSPSITAKNTQVIQLPPPGTGPDDGMTVVVTGWGNTAEVGFSSDVLQMVKLSVVNHKECTNNYSGMYIVTERMFCVSGGNGLHGSCYGDSGGPVVIDGVQYGIVSWAAGCARPGYPTVFTNVALLRTWIDESCTIYT